MKLIAFFLPQFHTIPENNEWWGDGFTDWTNTKKALPLFDGHYQPREPFDDNYYNLLDSETREWQATIAKEYGIYGFCYYHYWFNGKMLLEKPLEKILGSDSPDFPFCLSWANEPWTRSWDGCENQVLMPQDYNKEDWERHFYYLLKAFKDERYIKVDGKPMFVIYRSLSIPDCDQMLKYWDILAKENGLPGLYLVNTRNTFEIDNKNQMFDASLEFEPLFTTAHDMPKYINKIRKTINTFFGMGKTKWFLENKIKYLRIDYDYIWQRIINRKRSKNEKVFLGAFVDWDNSARKKNRPTIFKGAKPEKFCNYLKLQIENAKKLDSDFIFINAWNEWAEGTYLEPDKKYGLEYLEAVRKAINNT